MLQTRTRVLDGTLKTKFQSRSAYQRAGQSVVAIVSSKSILTICETIHETKVNSVSALHRFASSDGNQDRNPNLRSLHRLIRFPEKITAPPTRIRTSQPSP